jgi:hypothetical protein
MSLKNQYQSYLLRVWREGLSEERRASLQNITSGEINYFANLTDMFAFLCLQVHSQHVVPRSAEGAHNEKQTQP